MEGAALRSSAPQNMGGSARPCSPTLPRRAPGAPRPPPGSAQPSAASGRPLRARTHAGLYPELRCFPHTHRHSQSPALLPALLRRRSPAHPRGTAHRAREEAAAAGPETLLEERGKRDRERERKRKISLPAYEMLKRRRGALRVSRSSCKFTDEFPRSPRHGGLSIPLRCEERVLNSLLFRIKTLFFFSRT